MLELNKKAIFMDLDGTLADTDNFYPALRNWFIEHAGLRKEDIPDRLSISFHEFMYRVGIKSNKFDSASMLYDVYRAKVVRHYAKNAVFTPGALSMLKLLKDLGLPVYIVSGSCRQIVEVTLSVLGVREMIDGIICTEDVTAHKPDSDVYYRALCEAHCSPNEALAFENSETGCTASLSAGIPTVLIGNVVVPYTVRMMVSQYNSFVDVLKELDEEEA